MRKLSIKKATASLEQVIADAQNGTPSIIVRDDGEKAIVLGYADWLRLKKRKDLFSNASRTVSD